jgi:hypothetical protein
MIAESYSDAADYASGGITCQGIVGDSALLPPLDGP